MPFKVVQTIENSEICLSVVPSTWKDDGTLYWPNKSKLKCYKLQKNENSVPEEDWEKMACIKKREFCSFREAEEEVSKMECGSDTEENSQHQLLKPKRKSILLNLNHLMEDKSKGQKLMETPTKSEANQHIQILQNVHNSMPNQHILKNSQIKENLQIMENLQNMENPQILQNQQILGNQRIDSPSSSILSDNVVQNQDFIVIDDVNQVQEANSFNFQQILDNQNTLIQQQAKFQVSLESLINVINHWTLIKQLDEVQSTDNDSSNFISPINNEEKLREFEEKLTDPNYFNKVVQKMSYICGKSGKENGIDVCYKLIDYFLERNFVTKCSWTGNTREGGNTSKVPIKYFLNFRHCFLKTVMLADKEFSEQQCDVFLKRIIKNSMQRKSAKKILSTHKKRQKKLTYAKKKTISEEPLDRNNDPEYSEIYGQIAEQEAEQEDDEHEDEEESD